MTIAEKMKAKLFAAEILGDDGCSRGRARERKGQLQIVWDDGVVENIVRVKRCRVKVHDIIEHEDKRSTFRSKLMRDTSTCSWWDRKAWWGH